MWLIRTKLRPPPPTERLIPRQRLRRRLPALLRARLVLVHAPAGFGKTCLLAEWQRQLVAQRVRVAWLSLHEDDSEPLQFLAYLTAALAESGVDVGALGASAEHGFPDVPTARLIGALDRSLRRLRGRTVIILDDFHRLRGKPIERLLASVVGTLDERVCFVVAGRERPTLLADDTIPAVACTEIASDQLRFTRDEARTLLERTSSALDDDDLHAIVSGTDGWAMAITAVRDWLAGGLSATRVRGMLARPTADLGRYITGQILRGLGADEHEFLLRTALVDRFCVPLAHALCADLHVDRIIASLAAKDLVIALDDDGLRWFRYHRLLAELATARLSRSRPYLVDELQRRAAGWFFGAGLHAEAVRHAVATRDPRLLAGLFEQAGGWHLAVSGYVGLTRKALLVIPPEVLREYPRAQLARVLLLAKPGQVAEADAELDQFRARHFTGADAQLRAEAVLLDACVKRYADSPVTAGELEAFERLADDLPPQHAVLQGTHGNMLMTLQYERGDLEAALETARLAAASYRRAGSMFGEIFVYVHQGSALIESGRLREAVDTLRQAWQLARDTSGPDTETEAVAGAMLAAGLYARGELVAAAELLRTALPGVESGESWFDLLAATYLTAALLALRASGREAALEIVRRARATAARRSLARLATMADLIELRVELCSGRDRACGSDALAMRVRRVADDDPTLRLRLRARIDLARRALVRGDAGAAWADARAAAALARSCAHRRLLLEAHLVEACAAHALADGAAAQLALDAAVAAAMHEGHVQAFLDSGPALLPLLQAARPTPGERSPRVRDRFLHGLSGKLEADDPARGQALSERERAVAGLLGRGLSNKAIAKTMRVSDNTVKYHLKNIYAKLGVATRRDAAAALGAPGPGPTSS
jgi:LuxR family maltose regulon positive regulatory protein